MALFKVKAVPDFTQLRNELTKLSSTPVKIQVDATDFNALSNQAIKTMNATARLTKAQNELAVAQEKTKQTANQLAAAQQKTTQTANQLATQMERTATAEEKARKANLDLSREIQKATTEQEKQKTVAAQTALQQEKTATSAANLAVQQEKTATTAAKAAGSIKEVGQEAKNTSAFADLMGDSFGRVFARMAIWQVLGDVISKTVSAFKDAIATMKDVDTEMVNVQKVTDYSKAQMQELEANAYSLASAYGRAADEITTMYTTFARAGYIGDQLDSMTELGTLLSNIGDVSGDTASKFLLAVDAAWKLNGSEKDLMTVMDGLNEVTNKNAVDMEALTSGITVAGSVFAEAGESVQTFSALVGAGVAATQRSGSEISRALRTIVMNIRQIRGETEDGELIDGESIANASKALKEYAGINTMVNGQLRLSSDVLKDLAAKWNDLDTVAQSAISEALAGKRQANVLSSLMGNWDTVEKMMTDYADGVGSALRENEIYMDSWEAKSKKLSAAWTEFVSHLIETDAIKGALDGLIGLVELLDTDVGRFVVTVGAATAGFALLAETVKALKGLELVKDVKAFGGVLIDAAKGSGTLSDALGLLNLKSLAVVAGIAALVALIAGLKQMYEATFPTAESFTASINDANEKIKTNKERLDEINNIPWNERTEAILSEKKALEEENEELKKNIELTEQRSVSAAKTALFGSEGSAAYVAGGTALGGFRPGGDTDSTATTEANIKAAQEYITVLREEGQLTDEQNIKVQDLLETMQERAAYYEILKEHSSELNESELEKLDLLAQESQSYEDLVSAYDQAVYGTEALINAYVELNNNTYITEETYQRLIGIYPQLAEAATQTADGYVIQKDALENLMSAEQRQQAEIQNTVSKLIEEAQQAGYTGQAMYDYAASLVTAGNTQLNVSQQIAALQAIALQAGYTAQDVANAFAFMAQLANAAAGMEGGSGNILKSAFGNAAKNMAANAWSNLTSNYTPSVSKVDIPNETPSSGGSNDGSSGSSGKRGSSSGSGSSDSAARKEAQAAIKQLQKDRDAELDVIQKQIDALEEQAEIEDRQAKIEEYKLDILKKQDAVMNARNERTVRQYNASTGQWEWVADATKVKKAEEDLENAKKALREYERKIELDLAVEELKTRQEAIKAAYQIKIDAWQDYLDGLAGAISSEAQYLQQSVANNKAATDTIKKMWEETNATKDNTGTGGSDTDEDLDKDGDGKIDSPDPKDDTVYAPSTASAEDIKIVQAYLGATIDGKWGTNSATALKNSRFTSFDEAYRYFFSDGGGRDRAQAKVDSGDATAGAQYRGAKQSGYSNDVAYAVVARSYKYYDEGGILQGMGGIKATPRDEIVLPPKLAARMLTPQASQVFQARVSELGYVYGAEQGIPKSLRGNSDNRSYTDNSGTRYQIGSIVMTEQQAKSTTIYEAAQQAHNLQAFSA